MRNSDTLNHVLGKSNFLDDIPIPERTLSAYVIDSPIAHGNIKNISYDFAIEHEGIVTVLTSKDIPGLNQIGGIIKDEVLLADKTVEFIGQPVAIIIADNINNARNAAKLIEIEIEEIPPILDARDAYNKNSLIVDPITFESGDINKAWNKCINIFEGTVETGGQEHLYLETQGSISIPSDNDGIKIISSTQSPTSVQRCVSGILGIPMNKIEVDVARLGGGFGGKEDQASIWASLSALSAWITKKPVKLILDREQDLRMTGGRNPYSSDYKIGFDKNNKIIAYEVTFYQNSGASADLSTAILERSLFHATNSYFVPNVKATGICCKTNLVPNTAFRGFGGPQAMFVIESALYKAAIELNVSYAQLQQSNLIKASDSFYYGQKVKSDNAVKCFAQLTNSTEFEKIQKEINEFNSLNILAKKGYATIPICFGISFTSSFMNQASALVHVYSDGSIGISTAAVEMGQGVNQKIREVAAKTFSVDISRIKIETTNTTRVANTSPTAASSASDLNGNSVIIAIEKIKKRLKEFAFKLLDPDDIEHINIENEQVLLINKPTGLFWDELINKAFLDRVNLSAYGSYATPKIYFDRETNQGNPFAYYAFGSAVVVSKVDCLRGIYEIELVKVVHDLGESLNTQIDIGQIEGAITQGIGWLTSEEIKYSDKGKLLANSLSTYKVPDIYASPKEYQIEFLEDSKNEFGPFNSKAIGEPPFMYGIAAYFAIVNAMKAFNPRVEINYKAPLTPENVLMQLYKGLL